MLKVTQSYYASLCFYALKQLGLIGGMVNPEYKGEAMRLNEIGEAFSFKSPSAGGPIFTLIYQIPSSLNPKHREALKEIEEALIEFINKESIDSFHEKWPKETKYWDKWYTSSWMNYLFQDIRHNKKQAIEIITYFMNFLYTLWPFYEDIYYEKMKNDEFHEREKQCLSVDVFHIWEKELGTRYPYEEFSMIICPESFSTASSIGPQAIVFGAKHDIQMMKHTLIHEVGVRFMNLDLLSKHPKTKTIMDHDYFGIIKLIEVEVCFRKKHLMKDLNTDHFLIGMHLESLMEFREEQVIETTIVDAFAKWYHEAKQVGLL